MDFKCALLAAYMSDAKSVECIFCKLDKSISNQMEEIQPERYGTCLHLRHLSSLCLLLSQSVFVVMKPSRHRTSVAIISRCKFLVIMESRPSFVQKQPRDPRSLVSSNPVGSLEFLFIGEYLLRGENTNYCTALPNQNRLRCKTPG